VAERYKSFEISTKLCIRKFLRKYNLSSPEKISNSGTNIGDRNSVSVSLCAHSMNFSAINQVI
jgi:hypothetical protein